MSIVYFKLWFIGTSKQIEPHLYSNKINIHQSYSTLEAWIMDMRAIPGIFCIYLGTHIAPLEYFR